MTAAVAAIQFALVANDGGMDFLRHWNEGSFNTCRQWWPEAPDACYIGADPLYPKTKQANHDVPDFAVKVLLVEIHDALCSHLGDSDPQIDPEMTDEEICFDYPVFWAAKEIAALIGPAPWDQYCQARDNNRGFEQ